MTTGNGNRVICKHKGDEFRETASPRVVTDPSQLKVMTDAQEIADEWVTPNRLEHILQKIPDHKMEKMPEILAAMTEDILREGAGEITDTPVTRKAIRGKTVIIYKAHLKRHLENESPKV
jgi:hypothetical protein